MINHLINLTDVIPASPLESLRINTLFFDAGLCTAVASIGSCGVLKELTIGTKGTKLLSAGFREMIEGCIGLERLVLDGVEGALAWGFKGSANLNAHAVCRSARQDALERHRSVS